MNFKKLIDLSQALKDHEENASDPKKNVATGSRLYGLEKDFKEVLKEFEVRPEDVNTSPIIEVYPTKGCTVPNLYLTEITAQDRARGDTGRSRLLRIPPVKATAEFTLLGASIRFRTYDIFVEFDPKSGDYVLCITAPEGEDNDYIKSPAPEGILLQIQLGGWKA